LSLPPTTAGVPICKLAVLVTVVVFVTVDVTVFVVENFVLVVVLVVTFVETLLEMLVVVLLTTLVEMLVVVGVTVVVVVGEQVPVMLRDMVSEAPSAEFPVPLGRVIVKVPVKEAAAARLEGTPPTLGTVNGDGGDNDNAGVERVAGTFPTFSTT
jgi:hypothetical protein